MAERRTAVVLDIDGTLFDVSARLADAARRAPPGTPPFWDAFLDPARFELDRALPRAAECVRELAREHAIVYLSGRRAASTDATRAELRAAGLPDGELILRPRGAPTVAHKVEALLELRARYDIVCGVGDRPEDAAAYLAAGVRAVAVVPNVDWDDCPCARAAAGSTVAKAGARDARGAGSRA